MFRIPLIAAAVALYGATAVAQGSVDSVGGATSRGEGSTGPTFPVPGPETLIATGTVSTDINVRTPGQPGPNAAIGEPDTSGQVPSPSNGPAR